jgi:SAM-dependent methyltransferase
MVIESNFYYFKRMKKIDYYNQFADEFALATLYVDMESIYQPFLAELPNSAWILDLGCGSGRDTLAFKNKGYQVGAIDYSEVLVERATNLLVSLFSSKVFMSLICTMFMMGYGHVPLYYIVLVIDSLMF